MGYLVIVTVLGWTRCSLDQVFIIIIEGCCWGSVLYQGKDSDPCTSIVPPPRTVLL